MADASDIRRLATDSLPVPLVQILAAEVSNGSIEIPERYIRPELEADTFNNDDHVGFPVVDMAQLLDPVTYKQESVKFEHACQDWGFFQLINHGVPAKLIDQLKADTAEFFKLPPEEKKAFAQLPGSVEGYGQAMVTSDDQKLDWGDMLLLITHPASTRKTSLWPTTPSSFRETLDKYSVEVKKLTESLYRLIARSLGVNEKFMLCLFQDIPQRIKFNYYPPCPKADKVMGLFPHTDAVGLTVLLQANEVQGLQIKKSGKWFLVPVQPGALVVNIGDVIEILSNGRFKSVEHRAMTNPAKERISIVAFHSPCSNIMLTPFPEIVKKDGVVRYKATRYVEYMKAFYKAKPEERCQLETVKLYN